MLIKKPVDDALLRKCKVQEVAFDEFVINVVRLKIPVPSKAGADSVGGHKFLTRMKDTDYFQVLSMYFPYLFFLWTCLLPIPVSLARQFSFSFSTLSHFL